MNICRPEWCPVCHESCIRPGMKRCPSCGLHIRQLGDEDRPPGEEFWVFFPPEKKAANNGKQGWWQSTNLGIPILYNETTTPADPTKDTSTTREDDESEEAHYNALQKAGKLGKAQTFMPTRKPGDKFHKTY
jgi:predicted secreted protein